jgi:hypothetical protein
MYSDGKTTDLINGSKWTRNPVTRKVETVIKRIMEIRFRQNTPAISEIKSFEDDLFNLIGNIEFRNARNEFQKSLANDLKKINSSPNIFIFADKITRNIYETLLDIFDKLMHDDITKTYNIYILYKFCISNEISRVRQSELTIKSDALFTT